MWSYVELRKKTLDKTMFKLLRIWGQPKAWVDTQICVQLADLLHEVYGQTLVICDCLGARWSKPSVLSHWANQSILMPLSPEATPFLAEPDTHQHAQIKACIREVKSRLQFELEQEATNKCKTQANKAVAWGPNEYIYIVARGLEKFVEKNPGSPLQGLIENHILAIRPSIQEDGVVKVMLLDDCKDATTQAMMAKPEIRRYPAARGIQLTWAIQRDAKARDWQDGKPPKPQWDELSETLNSQLVEDPMPKQPSGLDIVFEADMEDLELSEQQLLMLLPVDMRIKQLQYPAAIASRIQYLKQPSATRKNTWANKLTGHFAKNSKARWINTIRLLGVKQGIGDLKEKQGPTVIHKKKALKKKKDGTKSLAKAKQNLKTHAKRKQELVGEESHTSHWLKKEVRVVAEDLPQVGRVGTVMKVCIKGQVSTLSILSETWFFDAKETQVRDIVEESNDLEPPLVTTSLDYRGYKEPRRKAWASELNITPTNIHTHEQIVMTQMQETGSIAAGLVELKERFLGKVLPTFKMFPPETVYSLSNEDGLGKDQGNEIDVMLAHITSLDHCFFVIHADAPRRPGSN